MALMSRASSIKGINLLFALLVFGVLGLAYTNAAESQEESSEIPEESAELQKESAEVQEESAEVQEEAADAAHRKLFLENRFPFRYDL